MPKPKSEEAKIDFSGNPLLSGKFPSLIKTPKVKFHPAQSALTFLPAQFGLGLENLVVFWNASKTATPADITSRYRLTVGVGLLVK